MRSITSICLNLSVISAMFVWVFSVTVFSPYACFWDLHQQLTFSLTQVCLIYCANYLLFMNKEDLHAELIKMCLSVTACNRAKIFGMVLWTVARFYVMTPNLAPPKGLLYNKNRLVICQKLYGFWHRVFESSLNQTDLYHVYWLWD